MTLVVWSIIFLNTVLNTAAQIALKAGMTNIGHFSFVGKNILPITLKIISSPWIITGVGLYVGSLIAWLLVLSRTPVSIAYPLSSLGYIVSAIAAYYLLGENLTITKILGIFTILVGVYLMTKS